MRRRAWIITAGLFTCTSTPFASSLPMGMAIATPMITKDPEYLRSYQIAAWLQPPSLKGEHLSIYFNFSAGHTWVSNTDTHHSLNIYAISPIFRYYFARNSIVSPFLNAGIGLSYLSRTKLDHQRLGIHFAFQDQLGLGVTVGKTQQLSFIISAFHYSNGSLCRINQGITVPMMFSLEYGFA